MVGKADIYNTKTIFNRWKVKYVERLHPKDREDITKFIRELQARGYTPTRMLKYLSYLRSAYKHLKKPFRELSLMNMEQLSD
ncbi:MAG: hypothetical protein GXO66_02530 [Euryarchaeota archaeon]|nr:hypothetical protein [Euryarchaeota archaeon]